ncbi:N-formimino-L-glutamate deiminase [Sphingomonas sp. Leaf412]|uniref:formimidoylglutamate deiminase n=1 Tax=Sphingomonas sp. Leaf412 TaxID=1736370 RepID=UPI0006F26CB3|nr:formimidoylglutamate deiminase [Sphingomonas sp. Leaf412]KQT32114.1 N-formimino-L-glutamate deiminase [Sphingomonas sp. Leaf412]
MRTIFFGQALLPDGWARDVRVSIADGRIAAIEPRATPRGDEPRHATALPGLPNLHSHSFQRLMAGRAERRSGPAHDDFWSWRELMYRILHDLTPDDVAAIAAMAFVEMLEAGFTRVGEFHYLHHQPSGAPYADPAETAAAVAGAAAETGIALTLLPVFYAHSGFGGTAPTAGQRRFVTDLDGFATLHDASRRAVAALPDAVVGIAPHSLRAVTPDELAVLATMAPDAPIHIHVAEQVKEVADCLAWSGRRPVAWLLDHQAVDARWCLVHATHVDAGEMAAVAASGAVVGLCPITEANLGDGLFPADAYLSAGGAFGIGSDSNVRIDAAEELRLLEYGQRLSLRRRTVLAAPGASTGETLVTAVLHGGAHALGADAGFAVGAPADLVALSDAGEESLDRWIFAGGGPRVDAVWRAGRQVVEGGRHRTRDAVAARYARVAARLLRA